MVAKNVEAIVYCYFYWMFIFGIIKAFNFGLGFKLKNSKSYKKAVI